MLFRVVDTQKKKAKPGDILLVRNNWNDWYIWYTLFSVIIVTDDGTHVDVGPVKIARDGMTRNQPESKPPAKFEVLGDEWFSIGQTENYYETLNTFGDEYRDRYLSAIKDCAHDLSRLKRKNYEEVLDNSLLRDIDQDRVRNRFHRLANGNAILTKFEFKFTFPPDPCSADPPPELDFSVKPGSRPPSNVHVLIGPNGVGKTRCFDLLSRTFLGLNARDGSSSGTLTDLKEDVQGHKFAGLITVSFSPFDEYGPLVTKKKELVVRYEYVGLISPIDATDGQEPLDPQEALDPQEPLPKEQPQFTIKGKQALCREFVESVEACRSGARRARWSCALKVLEADPLFAETNVSEIAEDGLADWKQKAELLFPKLSSGHCVVLLAICKLVELVEEKSLVLIDEPESHLHPPLLSAFIRVLSDLLVNRNGVAIITTHSPVVLQEVPKSCAWILNRSGSSSRAERPALETFGENVGTLTREVFGLEVINTGFHQLISEAAKGRTYDETLQYFSGKLGAEARGLARLLTLSPPAPPPSDEQDFD